MTDGPESWFDIAGKSALVTGGTSGIGLMIARGLLLAGVMVIVASRKEEGVKGAAADLSDHGRVIGLRGDVSSPDGARELARAVGEQTEKLNILVNNAGVTWGDPLEEFPDSGWDRVMHTNVEGLFHLTVACLPLLRAAATSDDPARVINLGSIDGIRTSPRDNYSYGASKAAVHHLSRQLAGRLAPENITVNAIAPGPFESRMTKFVVDDPELREEVLAEVPLRRWGRMEDVAGMVQFLSSRAGSYVTGAVLPLDGGVTGAG
jgi:NAD(P)-dependent dehydrogenase (short-subunit alcohol dehydrogenase family)